MSKFDDLSDLSLDEQLLEAVVEQGPTPSIVPSLGSTKQVMDRYSHCDLCGGRLHFIQTTDFSRNTTHEKVTCPECGLEARQVLHRLQ